MNADVSASSTPIELSIRPTGFLQVASGSLPVCIAISAFIMIRLSEEGWTPVNLGYATIMVLVVAALPVVVVTAQRRRASLTGTALTVRGLFGERRVDLGAASVRLKSHVFVARDGGRSP